MAYLEKTDLSTHLYGENIDTITRGDDTLVSAAINAAISEAKGYLSAYDIETIFATTGTDREELLLTFVKDIAVWHLIVLSNAGTGQQLRQDRYERAVSWLKEVQKGNISPNLPKAVDEEGVDTGDPIVYGSNEKKTQHF